MRKKRIAAGTVVLGVFMVIDLATGFTLFSEACAADVGARDADAASPQPAIYLEGTIYTGSLEI